jgi:hypothetical protein
MSNSNTPIYKISNKEEKKNLTLDNIKQEYSGSKLYIFDNATKTLAEQIKSIKDLTDENIKILAPGKNYAIFGSKGFLRGGDYWIIQNVSPSILDDEDRTSKSSVSTDYGRFDVDETAVGGKKHNTNKKKSHSHRYGKKSKSMKKTRAGRKNHRKTSKKIKK